MRLAERNAGFFDQPVRQIGSRRESVFQSFPHIVGANGQPVIPVSIGLCLGIIFLGKILAAQLMRLFLIRQSNKKA